MSDDSRWGSSVRSEDAVVPMAVHARRGNEPGDTLQEWERREQDLGAPVGRGLGEAIEEPSVRRSDRWRAARSVEALEGERRPGRVAQEALDARTVVALDADGGIDAEPAGTLPGKHAHGIGFVEKGARTEMPEHAALNDTLELEPVALVEQGRLVEADSPLRVRALRVTGLGAAVGLAIIRLLAGPLDALLFGVSTSDPAATAGALVVVTMVAVLVAYVPARRAAWVAPAAALVAD